MNPFDQTPSTPPVSLDPPDALIQPAPRRGRMALAALTAAGLMGIGLVGVSQFASADRPEIDPDAAAEPVATPDDETDDESEPVDPTDDGDAPEVDGRIVIDDGDGEPIVIDLGDGTVDGQSFEEIAECIGLPAFGELELGELPFEKLESMLDEFSFEDFEGKLGELPFEQLDDLDDLVGKGDFGVFGTEGSHVTVLGPDGLTVIELGDEDGSVTITQEDGEVTIDTEGAATVREFDEMFEKFELPDLESLDIEEMLDEFPFEEFEQMLPDDFEGFEDFEQMLPDDFGNIEDFEQMLPDDFGNIEDFEQMLPDDFELQLPTDIQDCLDAAGDG